MSLDVEKLLSPVSAERPCGEDLSYDPAFLEVEQIAAGKPEREVGNEVIPAEPPDWKLLRAKSAELLGRTKDLRVVIHLGMASLKLDGLPGLRDALAVLRGVLERHWDQVHPQLDPADGNDPLLRMNVISALIDPAMFRQSVREAPLASSPQLGRFGLREIEIASGEAPPPANAPKLETSMIDGAFTGTSLEHLQAVESAAGESIESVKAIDAFLTTQVGTSRAISLRDLETVLAKARAQAQKYLAKRGVGTAPAADVGNGPGRPATNDAAAAGNGELRSKQDIIDTIDSICDWYLRNEPSSPVPLLLKRARRLVSKNFLEIIKDLTPDSLRAIEALAGQENGDS
jgi:type VI secretion system protein ImpA